MSPTAWTAPSRVAFCSLTDAASPPPPPPPPPRPPSITITLQQQLPQPAPEPRVRPLAQVDFTSAMGIARGRLQEERKSWRKDHPHGFVAKPATLPDGTQDILNWDVVIPGKDGTIWEGARIPMTMTFSEDYPNKPPVCKFKFVGQTGKPLFHPNVYPSGKICLSLLDPEKGWKPSLTIKHLLVGIQTLLDDPNNLDPAQEEPFRAFKHNKAEYEQKVKAQVVILRQNAL